jgi:small subunit ribosomal protein S20
LTNPAQQQPAKAAVKRTSAEQAARVALKKHERNTSFRSEVKTNIIRAEKLIFAGDVEGARAAVNLAFSTLDKAAEKKMLHGNNAGRRKARLMKKLNHIKAKAPAENKPEKAA